MAHDSMCVMALRVVICDCHLVVILIVIALQLPPLQEAGGPTGRTEGESCFM